jgi:4-amino-4-deoxy-L-arabinose transferase-like glycosyltransferase
MTSSIKVRIADAILGRRPGAFFFVLLAAIYYLVFWMAADLKDTAYFGGDTWEYQSMGVNFAKGHGLQIFGGVEPFETYKFEPFDSPPAYYNEFFARAGRQTFYRTPVYQLFLGLVYKAVGISPRTIKCLQLLMLVVIAAALPFIGLRYWEKSGFIAGLVAGVLYLATNRRFAEEIMTECLTAFAVFLVLVSFMAHERRRNMLTAISLGLSLGFAPLVKGTLFFLPILIGAAILVRAVADRDPKAFKRLIVITAAATLLIAPWTAYVRLRTGAVVVLSTQGDYQLLADNTEFCADGRWHPEGIEKKDSFYNTDGIPREQVVAKVVNFYWHHPALLPRCMAAKFVAGFGPLPFLWMFAAFVILAGLGRMADRRLKSDALKVVCFSVLASLSVLAFGAAYHVAQQRRIHIDEWIAGGWLLPKAVPVVAIGWLVYLLVAGRAAFRIPTAFWIIAVNFLLMTLVFHAEPSSIVGSRLVASMDFIFALLCCASGIYFFRDVGVTLQKPVAPWTKMESG